MKFVLTGDGNTFIVEAPEDITLKQLLAQCDKIQPYIGSCGICSVDESVFTNADDVQLIIGYDSIRKVDDKAWCDIVGE